MTRCRRVLLGVTARPSVASIAGRSKHRTPADVASHSVAPLKASAWKGSGAPAERISS